ncbi:MAG: hypothetical protein JNM34_04375 [Chthonomonadaceae bacterium]|nr:hypothetical protein [Chthonomonadaceae bacterium]
MKPSSYAVTSDQTEDYNCIAWAVSDDQRWWDPQPGYYWPPGATRNSSVGSLIEAYKAIGFEPAKHDQPEDGYEKVAIYAIQSSYTHAARLLPSGKWASKLGGLEDIEHDTLDGLNGTEYGVPVYFMRKQK